MRLKHWIESFESGCFWISVRTCNLWTRVFFLFTQKYLVTYGQFYQIHLKSIEIQFDFTSTFFEPQIFVNGLTFFVQNAIKCNLTLITFHSEFTKKEAIDWEIYIFSSIFYNLNDIDNNSQRNLSPLKKQDTQFSHSNFTKSLKWNEY